jgi:hypothetical protein
MPRIARPNFCKTRPCPVAWKGRKTLVANVRSFCLRSVSKRSSGPPLVEDVDHLDPIHVQTKRMAAPFIHSKPGTTRSSDPAANAKLIDGAHGFIIEPVLARAIRDDIERLSELRRHGGRLSDAEEQEDSRIPARIAETAKAIGCPVGYGAIQARKDRHQRKMYRVDTAERRLRGRCRQTRRDEARRQGTRTQRHDRLRTRRH